jgi:hypothetical protein
MITRDVDPATWAKTEIGALRLLFSQDTRYAAPSQKQIMALNSLMGQGRSDRRRLVRIEMLRQITGQGNLYSSAQLTSHIMSKLIDYLKEDIDDNWRLSQKGKDLLSMVEAWAIEKVGPKPERKRKEAEQAFDEDGWPIYKPVRRRQSRRNTGHEPDAEISGPGIVRGIDEVQADGESPW